MRVGMRNWPRVAQEGPGGKISPRLSRGESSHNRLLAATQPNLRHPLASPLVLAARRGREMAAFEP